MASLVEISAKNHARDDEIAQLDTWDQASVAQVLDLKLSLDKGLSR
jgi:hypothetical protein